MKKCFRIFFTLLAAMTVFVHAQAQGNMYTRKARLENFPSSTTKIVFGGGPFVDAALKEEIATRWRVSPYEYCTPQEYNALKNSPDLYFLRFTTSEGLMFLTMSKGGKEDEADDRKKPFDVISIPIACESDPSGREILFMGAFIDIIQRFMEDAMANDRAGYGGLKFYDKQNLEGREVYLKPDDVDRLYTEGQTSIMQRQRIKSVVDTGGDR